MKKRALLPTSRSFVGTAKNRRRLLFLIGFPAGLWHYRTGGHPGQVYPPDNQREVPADCYEQRQPCLDVDPGRVRELAHYPQPRHDL